MNSKLQNRWDGLMNCKNGSALKWWGRMGREDDYFMNKDRGTMMKDAQVVDGGRTSKIG